MEKAVSSEALRRVCEWPRGLQEVCMGGRGAEGEMRPEGRELVGTSGEGLDVDSSELGSHGRVPSRGEMGSDFHF